MAKHYTLTMLLLSAFALLQGQDPKEILGKSYQKCQSVQQGYYEATRYARHMGRKDTFETSFNCYFRKVKDDSIFPCFFKRTTYDSAHYAISNLYTGNELVYIRERDSAATITSQETNRDHIKEKKRNYDFYEPLMDRASYPLPRNTELAKSSSTFAFVGKEVIAGLPCYHIQMNALPDKKKGAETVKTLLAEYHYWIDEKEFLPRQYSAAFALFMNGDTMKQYERLTLHKFTGELDDKQLTLEAIPQYYQLNNYVEEKIPLLAENTMAPDWNLNSLTGEKVRLSDLKGKVVLIDFFFKSCFPCTQAMPVLESLHKKYKKKGLVVTGINPYDKLESIKEFLAKKGVTYSVLFSDKDLAKQYQVSGYPTMYLLDKTGKIIFTQVGFGDDHKDIKKAVKKAL